MPTEIASLYASVGADTSGLQKGLQSVGTQLAHTEQQFQSAGKSADAAAGDMSRLGGEYDKVAAITNRLNLTLLQLSDAQKRLAVETDPTKQAKLKVEIDNLRQSADKLQHELDETAASTKKLGSASATANDGLQTLMKVLQGAAVVAFAKKVATAVYELGVLGAQAERTEATFARVAGGAAHASSLLDTLKAATMGTKSEMELMAGATNLMALGFGESADQIGNIMRNVEALGARFGGNMQTFQLMMSNDSLMRIDSFGIGVAEATKRIEEYKAAGMEAGKAFDTAILDLMNEKYESLGGTMEDNVTALQRNQAAWQDLRSEIGIAFAGTVGGVAGTIAGVTRMLADQIGTINEIRNAWGEAATSRAYYNTVYGYGQGTGLRELEEQLNLIKVNTPATSRYADMQAYLAKQAAEAAAAANASLNAWNMYAKAQGQVAASAEKDAMAHVQLREEMARAEAAAANQARATLLIAAVNSDFSDGLDEQTLTLDELRQKQADTRAEIDKLNASQGRAVTTWSKATLTEAEAALATLQLADAQAKLAAETDPLKAAQLAVKVEDLQGKLGGASTATTTFIDNTKKVSELEGTYNDLQAEIDAVTAATYKSVNAFMFQQMVSRMAADDWTDAELAMLDVLGEAAGIDTTFIKLAPLLDDAAAGVADIGTEAEVGASKGKQLAGIAADIAFRATEAGEAWSLVGAAYEAGGIHGAKVSRELRDDAVNLTDQFINMGNAGEWGFTAIEGAGRSSEIAMADIPPKITAIGDAAEELEPRFVDFAAAAGENLGAVEGAARSSAGGLTLIGNQALWAQEQIDKMHGKEIDVLFIYRDEDRRKGAGAGATSIGNPFDTTVPHEQNASGGWLNTGSASLVGERGPEMIYATSAGVQIEPLSGAGADGGTRIGSTWYGDIVIQGVSDPDAAASAVIRKLSDRGLIRAGGYR